MTLIPTESGLFDPELDKVKAVLSLGTVKDDFSNLEGLAVEETLLGVRKRIVLG